MLQPQMPPHLVVVRHLGEVPVRRLRHLARVHRRGLDPLAPRLLARQEPPVEILHPNLLQQFLVPVRAVDVPDGPLVVAEAPRHQPAPVAGVGALVPVDLGLGLLQRPSPGIVLGLGALGVEVVGDGVGGAGTEDAAADVDGIIFRDVQAGVDVGNVGMVPGGNVAIKDPREEAGGHVEPPLAGGDAGNGVEEAHGRQHEGQLDELDALGVPRLPVLAGDGNVARAEVVVRNVRISLHAINVDALAQELLLARPGADGAVGEAGGWFDLLLQLGQNVPEAFRGVGGS